MTDKSVEIRTDFIKLDQLLKFSSLAATGGEAKEIIADGTVCVNGEQCRQRGRKIRKGDFVTVEFDDEIVKVDVI